MEFPYLDVSCVVSDYGMVLCGGEKYARDATCLLHANNLDANVALREVNLQKAITLYPKLIV